MDSSPDSLVSDLRRRLTLTHRSVMVDFLLLLNFACLFIYRAFIKQWSVASVLSIPDRVSAYFHFLLKIAANACFIHKSWVVCQRCLRTKQLSMALTSSLLRLISKMLLISFCKVLSLAYILDMWFRFQSRKRWECLSRAWSDRLAPCWRSQCSAAQFSYFRYFRISSRLGFLWSESIKSKCQCWNLPFVFGFGTSTFPNSSFFCSSSWLMLFSSLVWFCVRQSKRSLCTNYSSPLLYSRYTELWTFCSYLICMRISASSSSLSSGVRRSSSSLNLGTSSPQERSEYVRHSSRSRLGKLHLN